MWGGEEVGILCHEGALGRESRDLDANPLGLCTFTFLSTD